MYRLAAVIAAGSGPRVAWCLWSLALGIRPRYDRRTRSSAGGDLAGRHAGGDPRPDRR